MSKGAPSWLPVICLSLTGFIFVTTELLPIGLLPDIAQSFHTTEANTGLLVTFYAWLVALCSLPLTIFLGRFERRKLLLFILCVFVISQWLSAMASNIIMLALARILTALAHAIFWSMTPPLAVRVAPKGKETKALAILSALVSLASVLGMPLSTMVGHSFGWRTSFVLVGIFALILTIPIIKALPKDIETNRPSFRSVGKIFKKPILIRTYFLTLMMVSAHFCAFTYINPILDQNGHFNQALIAWLLLWVGFSGVMGSLIINRHLDLRPKLSIISALILFCLSLWLANIFSARLISAIIMCFVWGASFSASALYLQLTVLKNSPDMAEVASSIYSGTFNVGIGGGALMGNLFYNNFGITSITYGAACFALAALATAFWSFWPKKG